jgi:hypothetical protein
VLLDSIKKILPISCDLDPIPVASPDGLPICELIQVLGHPQLVLGGPSPVKHQLDTAGAETRATLGAVVEDQEMPLRGGVRDG